MKCRGFEVLKCLTLDVLAREMSVYYCQGICRELTRFDRVDIGASFDRNHNVSASYVKLLMDMLCYMMRGKCD